MSSPLVASRNTWRSARATLHALHLNKVSRATTTSAPRWAMTNPRLFRAIHQSFGPVKPLTLPRGHQSLLPLALSCSNLVLPKGPWHPSPSSPPSSFQPHVVGSRTVEGEIVGEEVVVPFFLAHQPTEEPVGFIRPAVAAAIEEDHQKHFVAHSASPWDIRYSDAHPKQIRAIAFAEWVNDGGRFTRTMHIDKIVLDWRKRGMFEPILRGWSDEAYPVYTHAPKSAHDHEGDPIAFAIERAALPLLGLVNFGCLLIAYVHDPITREMKLWIPRRSRTKRTWPGMLDVTVGGGMGLGERAMTTIIRESVEEALLDPDYVQDYIRPVGVLSFPNRSPGQWILPGMYYLFDLPLPSDGSVTPRINALDGEVERFELLGLDETLQYLLDGQFKSSSAMAIIDFLIRHGYITEDTDPRYLDICRLLKADTMLPLAWSSK